MAGEFLAFVFSEVVDDDGFDVAIDFVIAVFAAVAFDGVDEVRVQFVSIQRSTFAFKLSDDSICSKMSVETVFCS